MICLRVIPLAIWKRGSPVICGICGGRMKAICHVRAGRRVPDFICDGRTVEDPQPVCQWISGKDVDKTVSQLLLETWRR